MAVAHVSGRAGAAAASVGGNVATVGSRGAVAREKEPEQAAKTDDTGRALARRERGPRCRLARAAIEARLHLRPPAEGRENAPKVVDDERQVRRQTLAHGLAVVCSFDTGEPLQVLLDDVGDLEEDVGALGDRGLGPGLVEGRGGRVDRRANVAGVATRRLAEHRLSVDRRHVVKVFSARGLDELTANEVAIPSKRQRDAKRQSADRNRAGRAGGRRRVRSPPPRGAPHLCGSPRSAKPDVAAVDVERAADGAARRPRTPALGLRVALAAETPIRPRVFDAVLAAESIIVKIPRLPTTQRE